MNNISLMKVTFAVALATLGSCIVSAEDDIQQDITKLKQDIKQNINKVSNKVEKHRSFSSLISTLDKNQNGQLSKSEITFANDKLLEQAFDKIDSNADSEITEKEFQTFLSKVNTALNKNS